MAKKTNEQAVADINAAGWLEAPAPSPVEMQTNEQIKPGVEPSVDTGGWELEDGTTITAEQVAADKKKAEEELNASSLGAASWLQDTLSEQEAWLEAQKDQNLADAQTAQKEDTANAEALASEQKKSLEEQGAENKRRETEIAAELEASKELALEKLQFEQAQAKRQADIDREALQVEKDALKQANEQALVNAEAETIKNSWQSTIAYRRLGLAVSWAIVQSWQEITNQWIQKILQIKAKMNLDERKFGIEDKKINQAYSDAIQKYTFEINDTINNYAEKANENKSSFINKYNEIAGNLRMSSLEKKQNIDKINQAYRAEKRTLERQYIEDTIATKERMVTNAERIERIKRENENEAKTKIQTAIASGAWHLKTPLEKERMLRQAGLDSVDWRAIEEKTTGDEIVRKVQEVMPEEYVLDFITKNKIRDVTNDLLKSWYSLDVAVDKATSEVLKDTEEYKRWQRVRALSLREKEAKLAKSIKWGSGGWDKTKLSLVVWTDWKYYNYNSSTWELKLAQWVWEEWVSEPVVASTKFDINSSDFNFDEYLKNSLAGSSWTTEQDAINNVLK